jgi:hypothetical protein
MHRTGDSTVKRWVLIAAAILALGTGLGLAFWHFRQPPADTSGASSSGAHPEYPRAAPPLRLRMDKWDFGTALPAKEMRHRFKITNSSDQPWTLKQITSTCTCTVGQLPSKTIKPGETAWLEVTYRTPLRDGKVSGHVMVDFVAPAGPVFQLTIEGEVRSLLLAEPPSLDFDYSPTDTPANRTITLRSRSDRRVAITRVDTPEWLQAQWRPLDSSAKDDRPPQVWKLVVTANPGKLRSAPEPATLVVHTDTAQVGPAYITVRLKAPLEVAPAVLAFGNVKPGDTRLNRVLLRTTPDLGDLSDKDLVLTHNLGDELDVEVHKEKAAHLFVLFVRFQPKRARGKVEGEVEIKTRKGTVLPVRVKVSGERGPG